MKFWVNLERHEWIIDLGFISNVDNYDSPKDATTCNHLELQAASIKDVVTMNILDNIVEKNFELIYTTTLLCPE